MWLYNREKTLNEIEREYNRAALDCALEAVAAAFEADPLSDDEKEELIQAAKGPETAIGHRVNPRGELGGKLIELLDSSSLRVDALNEHITQDADNSVTYTSDAQLMLLMTNNENAMQDELGEEPGSDGQRAAWAYQEDVREYLANKYVMADAAQTLLKGAS